MERERYPKNSGFLFSLDTPFGGLRPPNHPCFPGRLRPQIPVLNFSEREPCGTWYRYYAHSKSMYFDHSTGIMSYRVHFRANSGRKSAESRGPGGKWCPDVVRMMSEWCPNDVQMLSNWCPNDVQLMSKWCPNDVQLMPKWCPNHPNDVQTMSKCCPNDVQMLSKWCPDDA